MLKIGIDMGGTNIRAALVDENGIVRKTVVPCPAKEESGVVLETLKELIASIITPEVETIGVGVPSVVDVQNGIVYNVANIPSWTEVHLKDFLSKAFPGKRVSVNNDANCFALGEAVYGEGKGCSDVVGLCLGTGTGAGIIIGGKLYNGANVGAGEIGYLPYLDSVFEDYTCGAFFNRAGVNGKLSAQMARQGDEKMAALWNSFGHHVGQLIKAVVLAYDPQAIVIGGGIAGSADLYSEAMHKALQDFYYPQSMAKLKIGFTTNPDSALLGAASLL